MSSVRDRIRKLLAVANDTSVTEAEAAAFAAKAARLLIENGLHESDLGERAECTIVDVCVRDAKSAKWLIYLLVSVAESCMCTHYLRAGAAMHFVGRPEAVSAAREMLDYLITAVRRLAREYSDGRAQQESFKQGCSMRLQQRLAETVRGAVSGRELVLYETDLEAAKNWLADSIPGMKKRKSRSTHVNADVVAGFAAGSNVSMRREIND